MSRNGSGVYSLPAGNPVVTGTTISSSWANTTLSDIATALTGSVAADGQTAMTGNLQMANNKVTGLAVASASGDALSFGQAATISALTVSGTFAANGGATLGDASGDALTINSSAVSAPNGLNFNSDALVLNTSGNLGLGVTPSGNYTLQGANNFTAGFKGFKLGSFAGGASGTGFPWAGYNIRPTGTADSYLYDQTDHASALKFSNGINFYVAPSGTAGNAITFTQAMTLDASGNLGVGTTSPARRIGVVQDQNAFIGMRISNNSSGTSAQTGYEFSNGAQTHALGIAGTNYTAYGVITPNSAFLYSAGSSDISIAADGNSSIKFGTGAGVPERMRIDSSGNLLVGTTSSSDRKLFIKGSSPNNTYFTSFENDNASTPVGIDIRYPSVDPNNSGSQFLDCRGVGTLRLQIRSNGGIANYSANNVNLSDSREKTNVELAGSYLDKICAIPVKTFNYIDQNFEEDDGLTLGVIAQDVQAIAPELVMESNWAGKDEPEKMRLSIYQTDLQYALMKAIQEQQAIITDLKARIESLESK